MFEFCLESQCSLHDYDAFLTVAFAVNASISTWWSALYAYLRKIGEDIKKQNQEMAGNAIRLDENNRRGNCDRAIGKLARIVRFIAAFMAIAIAVAMLLLKSTTPLCFWCVALTGIICPVLLLLTSIIHRVWFVWIETTEREAIAQQQQLKSKFKVLDESSTR